jgi:glucose/arabinose dehydrogenase
MQMLPTAHGRLLTFILSAGCLHAEAELPALQITELVTGLHRPTSIVHAADGSGRLFVTEQTGTIRVIAGGKLLEEPLLDISAKMSQLDPICCDERGLLSVAFAPDFAKSQRFYVYYTGDKNEIHISRFRVSEDNPNRADPSSEEVLFRFEHVYENHFGGQLAFHPLDKKLYVSFGDGAGGANPLRSAQNLESPFGKIWRWDAEGGSSDLELNTLGLRNPWRFSFDRLTGDLFIGDVGEDKWEEVNYQPYGMEQANFGWSVLEGPDCFQGKECSSEGFRAPAIAYHHSRDGCSVTSGSVYRGQEIAALQGVYLYGDFCYGRIWGAVKDEERWTPQLLLEQEGLFWSAFGEDEAGEIYVMDYIAGTVYRLVVDRPELD